MKIYQKLILAFIILLSPLAIQASNARKSVELRDTKLSTELRSKVELNKTLKAERYNLKKKLKELTDKKSGDTKLIKNLSHRINVIESERLILVKAINELKRQLRHQSPSKNFNSSEEEEEDQNEDDGDEIDRSK